LFRGSTAHLVAGIEPDFDFAASEYRELASRAQATAFQTPEWLNALYTRLAPAHDARPFPFVVREGESGRPLLVLPLVRTRRHGLATIEMADFGVTDYTLPVYDPAEAPRLLVEPTLPSRLAEAISPHDIILIPKLPRPDAVLWHLLPQATEVRMLTSSYGVDLQGTWGEWRDRHVARRTQRYLDKKRRSLGRLGRAAFRPIDDRDDIEAAFDTLRRFRKARFASLRAADVMDDESTFRFYRDLAISRGRHLDVRTYVMTLDGDTIAVVFGLVHGASFLHLLLAFDAVRHARLSLGLLASEDAMRLSLQEGLAHYDFTIGDHAFKRVLGARPAPLYERIGAGSLSGRVAVAMLNARREAKRWLKPLLRPQTHPPFASLSDHQP